MTTVLLAGAGAVGAPAARQLADTPGLDRLLVADRSHEQAARVARALGDAAEAVELDEAMTLPGRVDAVASALPPTPTRHLARAAVAAGVPIAAIADEDDTIGALSGLDVEARQAGVTVAVGCGLAPGLADVLARHAADALDSTDEIHVARVGAAGDACIAALRRMRRDRPAEWRQGSWVTMRRVGTELVWFPEPIGARECESVAAGIGLLVEAVPGVERVTARVGEPPVRGVARAALTRVPRDEGWGAVRVEVWGWRGHEREPIVYGVVERTAVAAGTALAVTAARLAGLLPAVDLRARPAFGAHGLGALVEPVPFLAELARRGVRAAAFEGVAPA